MSHRTRRRLLLVVPAMAVAVVTAACGSSGGDKVAPSTSGEPSTTAATTSVTSTDSATDPTGPRPPVDKAAPDSINGLTVDGDTLWIASIDADTVFQVSRADGTILGRFPTGSGSGPDDGAVAPAGTVYSTGFKNGDIGQIRDGNSASAVAFAGVIFGLALSQARSLAAAPSLIEIALWGGAVLAVQLFLFWLVELLLAGLAQRVRDEADMSAVVLLSGAKLATAVILAAAVSG